MALRTTSRQRAGTDSAQALVPVIQPWREVGSAGAVKSTTVLIVWHSATGASEQLAQAARQGAEDVAAELEASQTLRCLHCVEAGPDDLLNADAYLFVCPENLAAIAGLMKDFFDRCYYPVLGRIEGRPYASMIAAGSDGHNAAAQIARIATGWRLKPVAEPLIVRLDAQTPEQILAPKKLSSAQCASARETGSTLAAGVAMGLF